MNFIHEFSNSIPDILCDKIIDMYEKSSDKFPGQILRGIIKDIKNTNDIAIPKNHVWEKINSFLYKELMSKLKEYINHITPEKEINMNISGNEYTFSYFNHQDLFSEGFLIQKYDKNVGKFLYHNDFAIHENKEAIRVLTFLWYLNNVEEGGETEFWGNYAVKPEKGKLLLFPTTWTYPHSGKIPISNDKYIITGWLYITM
jgi:hypothetical protein